MKSWQNKRGSKHSKEKGLRQRENTSVSYLFGFKCFFFLPTYVRTYLHIRNTYYDFVPGITHKGSILCVSFLKVMIYGHTYIHTYVCLLYRKSSVIH